MSINVEDFVHDQAWAWCGVDTYLLSYNRLPLTVLNNSLTPPLSIFLSAVEYLLQNPGPERPGAGEYRESDTKKKTQPFKKFDKDVRPFVLLFFLLSFSRYYNRVFDCVLRPENM